jgi:hypothetical protein
MGARFLYALIAVCTAMLVLPATAAATHNGDQHSPNVRLNYSEPPSVSGRTHSDVAMWGDIVVSGNYFGFRIFDVSRPPGQRLLTNFLCRGPQNDVSLWEHEGRLLLFLSNDTPQFNGNTVCGQTSASDRPPCSDEAACFEGIRIFDLSNPVKPELIRGVYTICGSHTHTLVPDLNDNRVLLYISSAGSIGGPCQPPHAKISIVQVPLDAPETASVLSTPTLIGPPYGSLLGCHDITVYTAINKAAAACQSHGQIWDITDPAAPQTQTATLIDDAGVNYWHSASFTWDGRYVAWNDESFTGRCNPANDGRIRIHRLSDNTIVSSFMIPRSQGTAYCSVHNGNIIPVANRYLLVTAWYAGGTSVIDFTNPAAPVEVGYYDPTVGFGAADTWSSYWYNNSIYANDIVRGLDVFNYLTPRYPYGNTWDHLNAQTQEADFFPPPPLDTMRPVARLLEPPTAVRRAGPGGYRSARAVKRLRTTARAPGSLLRFRARASKRR